MASIELVNIYKSFENNDVIKGISLNVNEGELISLLGPSGCGKSTTLKIISGLIDPEHGDVLFDGISVLNVPAEKRGSTIVFQDNLLFPHMTLEENIGFGLRMAGMSRSGRQGAVSKIIDLVQLNGHEKKYPSEVSGGQKQRAALARALAINPKVLLLDEPFSSLDERLRESMREFVSDIQRKLKITTILVTHDMEEALMMSDRVAVMLDGAIIQFGKPDEIYSRPKTREVADFFGDNNYIEGVVENKILNCSLGEFPVECDISGRVLVMIRPENVRIGGRKADLRLSGVITKKRYAGDRVYYDILLNGMNLKGIGNARTVYDAEESVSVDIDFNNAAFFLN